MKNKVLKVNSFFTLGTVSLFIVVVLYFLVRILIEPSAPNTWDVLGKGIAIIASIGAVLLVIPSVVSGISTYSYSKHNINKTIPLIFSIIGIIIYSVFLIMFVYKDNFDLFSNYYNGNVDIKSKLIVTAVVFIFYILPLLINAIILWKPFIIIAQGAIIIVGIILLYTYNTSLSSLEKIEITDDNLRSYSDFESELKRRRFLFEDSDGKITSIGLYELMALDSDSEYGYVFKDWSTDDFYYINKNTTKRFPFFMYLYHKSLIDRNDPIYDGYSFSSEDRYVNWYVYYVNGEVYAASEYVGPNEGNLSKNKYEMVVAESDTITVYNSMNNSYAVGGCIIDTYSGTVRSNFPTVGNVHNKKCRKIVEVETVNEGALDNMAKEIFKSTAKKN